MRNSLDQAAGRINVVDAIMMCGLAGLAILGVSGYRLLTTPQAPVRWRLDETMEVYGLFERVKPETAARIVAGAEDLDPTGRPVIRVLEKVSSAPAALGANLSSALRVSTGAATPLEQVLARLQLFGDIREDGQFYCKGRPVTIGGPLELSLGKELLTGVVRPGPERELFVLLRGESAAKEVATLISSGDPVYDHHGRMVGEVTGGTISATSSQNTTQMFGIPVEEKGFVRVALTTVASIPQIELWIRLWCPVAGTTPFINDEPLKIGKPLLVRSDRYDMHGIVIDLRRTAPPGSLQVDVPTEEVRTDVVQVMVEQLQDSVARAVRADDRLQDRGAQEIGRIVAVEDLGPDDVYQPVEDRGQLLFIKKPGLHRMKVTAELRTKGQAIRIGSPITLTTPHYELQGTIMQTEQERTQASRRVLNDARP